MNSLIFITHLTSCLFMTGVIWIVQLVHYPSFQYISEEKFDAFNKFHQASITFVVMPAMLIEIVTGFLLIQSFPNKNIALGLFAMICLIWLSTFFLSVPYHSQLLSGGYDLAIIKKLVNTNWPRTLLWSLRSIIIIYIFTNGKYL